MAISPPAHSTICLAPAASPSPRFADDHINVRCAAKMDDGDARMIGILLDLF